jgi:iron uptake system component EfeO
MRRLFFFVASALLTAGTTIGCSSDSEQTDSDATHRQNVTNGMHDTLAAQIDAFLQGSRDLQAAAPMPAGRGWDASQDATALAAMREAWKRVRVAYEKIEGAIAPLFPEIDFSVDARYDDFLAELNGQGDDNAFDDLKVTGQHAIERILFIETTPPTVVEFEKALPGYKPAALPATEQEAADFKSRLSNKLVVDVADLQTEWQPARIDLGGAFQGLISLMNEQLEKVNKAATHEEESRYAEATLADLRANLDGTITAYRLFKPWLASKPNPQDPSKDGPTIDGKIEQGFQSLRAAYDRYPGDAIPQPPSTWSSQNPTPEDLNSDFGKLFSAAQQAADPAKPGSIVDQMNAAAQVLGFPQLAP